MQKLNFTCSYGGGGDGPGRQLAAAEDDAGRLGPNNIDLVFFPA